MLPEHMDDGLTHVWALYWSASLSTGGVVSSTTEGPSSTVSVPQEEWFPVFLGAVWVFVDWSGLQIGQIMSRLWADGPSQGVHAGSQLLLSCLFVML